MITEKHYLNGVEVSLPLKHIDTEYEVNYDTDNNDISTTTVNYSFIDDASQLLYSILNSGTTGGNGVFQGVRHTIKLSQGISTITLERIIDLRAATFDKDLVEVESKPFAEIEWLNIVADGFTFEYLKSVGFIQKSDYQFMPYVISDVPNYKDTFLTTFTLVFLGVEIKGVIKSVGDNIVNLPTILGSLKGIIGLIFEIIYMVFLIITIIEMLLDLVALIIQKVKYKPMMLVNRLIDVACKYLGLNYGGGVLTQGDYAKMYMIPESFDNPIAQTDDRIRGFLAKNDNQQNGYYNGTFGDLLRDIKELVNGRIVITNSTLTIVNDSDIPTGATFTIPAIYNKRFRINAADIVSNFNISFSYDITDKNTIQDWQGTNVDVNYSPSTLPDARVRMIGGFAKKSIRFALAKRKEELTFPEKVVDVILETIGNQLDGVVNSVNFAIGVINDYIELMNNVIKKLNTIGIKIKVDIPDIPDIPDTNLGNLIDNRIGMMLLENDNITVPKLVIADVNSDYRKTKIATTNKTFLSAKAIFERHYKNYNRQKKIVEWENVPMTLLQFQTMRSEKAAKIANSSLVCEVLTAKYNPAEQVANITTAQPFIYSNSLTETINEPTGR